MFVSIVVRCTSVQFLFQKLKEGNNKKINFIYEPKAKNNDVMYTGCSFWREDSGGSVSSRLSFPLYSACLLHFPGSGDVQPDNCFAHCVAARRSTGEGPLWGTLSVAGVTAGDGRVEGSWRRIEKLKGRHVGGEHSSSGR